MIFLSVIIAAAANFAFGAVWYMSVAKPWMAASGVEVGEDGQPANNADPIPYITSFVAAVLVAGMMRHVFALRLPKCGTCDRLSGRQIQNPSSSVGSGRQAAPLAFACPKHVSCHLCGVPAASLHGRYALPSCGSPRSPLAQSSRVCGDNQTDAVLWTPA